ncbi:MAG TPA: hypothetical protein VI455_08030 [Terriglobia bacterium]
MKISLTVCLAYALAGVAACAGAQAPKRSAVGAKAGPAPGRAFAKEIGDLEARYDRAAWQSPELILEGLRSDNDEARLKAFHLLGATDEDAHETEYAPNGEATLVATPWKSELLYAPLGDGSTQQAIVAVQVRNLVLVAVAMVDGKGWQRIAAFRSLCPSNNTADSYGSANGGNILANTAEVGRVQEQGFAELILHEIDFPSQGDQVLSFDDYTEYEARFRLQGTQLRRVIAFKSRVRSCRGQRQAEAQPLPATGPRRLAFSTGSCSIERRRFYHYSLEDVADAFVAEARGEVPNPGPANLPFATDLESRYLHPTSCQALKFSEQTHQYEPVTVPSQRLSAIPICESAH